MLKTVFVSDLKQFKENNGGSPHYTINMCFGEKFPDGKALEKKLVVVQVTLISTSSKERTLWSSVLVVNPLCAHAGGPSGLPVLP